MRVRDVATRMYAGLGWKRGILMLSLLLVGCAATHHAGKRGLPETQGTASYYAKKFVGRSTANGEVYDPDRRTAAHPSLPFGTRVRVTRVDHAETPSVVVRINDRGPFRRGRIIDLSEAAARQIQMIRDGVGEVQLEVVAYPARVKTVASDSSKMGTSDAGW